MKLNIKEDITNEYLFYDTYEESEKELDEYFAYLIYNAMTDENTFICSKSQDSARKYGRKLYEIYKDYDEDTIDKKIDMFYEFLPDNVFVTDPNNTEETPAERDNYILWLQDKGTTIYVNVIGGVKLRF